jgi:hypothetical protein
MASMFFLTTRKYPTLQKMRNYITWPWNCPATTREFVTFAFQSAGVAFALETPALLPGDNSRETGPAKVAGGCHQQDHPDLYY